MRRIVVLASMLGALFLALGTGLLAGPGVAAADPPFRAADRVTDRAEVLDAAERAQVTGAIQRLTSESGYDLFVIYVDSFEGQAGKAWADRAAQLSQRGDRDVLLAVATGDRAYGTSYSDAFPVSAATTDRIETQDVEPRLSREDWAGAAVALADGLRSGGDSGGSVVPWVVGGAVVVGGGAYALSRRRRKATGDSRAPDAPDAPAPPADPFPGVSTEDLGYRSSQALLDVDDAVGTSERELAAARGHFGDEAVAEFAAALEASRADMLAAFEIRQQLDDEVPEDDPAQRRMHAEILRLATAADHRLDAQVEAFDRLRGLEADAPGYVDRTAARLDALTGRVPATEATWAALRSRYAASALEPVAENIPQARALLDAARTEVGEARAALAAPSPAQAVVGGRAAEDALTQAETLLDGVPRRETELADAATRVPAARAEVEQDLAEAGVLPTVDPAVVARARAAVTSAAEAAGAAQPDPLAALHLLDEAGTALDHAIADARAAQDRNRRAAVALDQALVTAGSAVAAASDFIGTRRGAVGAQARTRLAEAQRHLQQASGGGDPMAALREAQQADSMAQEALRLAQDDVSRWSGPAGGGGRSVGVDLGSLVLGGILSGALGGGGGHRSGGGFGGGGFGGGGGRSPGSFGGSSSRGRRGGGGRF
ncbi:MAG TPA: TPM domain-containing protein [Pseudonocardia sp.]|nr:TPM domain-containing protein [Pseudonocardia sp.]